MKTKTIKKRCGQVSTRSYIIASVLLLTLAFTAIVPNTAFAAPSTSPAAAASYGTGSSDVVNKALIEVQAKLSPVVSMLQSFLWPVLLMIGSLLQNDLLFGAGMEDRLLLIWTNIRNIVNIIFVFILLAIAFYNVFGAGENYTLKKELPKFIIALIAVNFTYLGAKVVLDAVNIVSTGLFALPDTVQQGLGSAKDGETRIGALSKEQANGVCSSIIGFPVGSLEYKKAYEKSIEAAEKAAKEASKKAKKDTKSTSPAEDKKAVSKSGISSICQIEETKDGIFTQEGRDYFSKFGAQNAALILAVAMGKTNLLSTVMVPASSLTVGNLIKNSLFSIILYVIYATAFIALFVVLLVRIVVLWIMIVLSPLMVLKYALPQNISGSLGDTGALQKKFVTHVIIPIKISLVLSIGFIMLDALQKADFSKLKSGINFLSTSTIDIGFLTSGISTLQEFIVAIGMVVFIWFGVFQALKETAAEGAVMAIKGAVGGVGKFIGKLPLMAPIFPVGGDKPNASLGAIGYALQQAGNIPHEEAMRGAEKSGLLIGRTSEISQKMREAGTWNEHLGYAGQGYDNRLSEEYQKAISEQAKKHITEFGAAWNRMPSKSKDKYKNDQNAFLNALAGGNIKDDEVMRDYLEAARVKRGTLPEGQGSTTTGAGEHLSGTQAKKLAKMDDLRKENKIDDGEKAKLKALNEAIQKGDATEIAKTKTEAEPILNRLIAVESTEAVMAVTIKDVSLTDKPGQEKFNAEMDNKIKALVKEGVIDTAAKKIVLDAVSKGMLDAQREEFKKLSGDKIKLLQEAAGASGSAPAAAPKPPVK